MTKLKILFIRHGQREVVGEDSETGLTDVGQDNTIKLANQFSRLDIRPEYYFASKHYHAIQTARILRERLSDSKTPDPIPTDTLTPHAEESLFSLESIHDLAESKGINLNQSDCVAFVGNETRLSQLITKATGKRGRPLDHLDVVCVTAEDFKQVQLGKAKMSWRIPVRAYLEEELRQKVNSKMTVAALLAGFTFTALLQVLFQKDGLVTINGLPEAKSLIPIFAVASLTTSLFLFVSAVYMYDRLTMPEGFWLTPRGASWERLPKFVRKNEERDGMVYSHMINVWERVFTPAVFFGWFGFTLIVLQVHSALLFVLYIIIVITVRVWYKRNRPELGVD